MTVLEKVKSYLGVHVTEEEFDSELLPLINEAVIVQIQLGVIDWLALGVIDSDTEMPEFDTPRVELGVLSRASVYRAVQISFDPTPSATLAEIRNNGYQEALGRVQFEVEKLEEKVEES